MSHVQLAVSQVAQIDAVWPTVANAMISNCEKNMPCLNNRYDKVSNNQVAWKNEHQLFVPDIWRAGKVVYVEPRGEGAGLAKLAGCGQLVLKMSSIFAQLRVLVLSLLFILAVPSLETEIGIHIEVEMQMKIINNWNHSEARSLQNILSHAQLAVSQVAQIDAVWQTGANAMISNCEKNMPCLNNRYDKVSNNQVAWNSDSR